MSSVVVVDEVAVAVVDTAVVGAAVDVVAHLEVGVVDEVATLPGVEGGEEVAVVVGRVVVRGTDRAAAVRCLLSVVGDVDCVM